MKVFISHGQNELAKLKLKDFVRETLKLEPLILADQSSDGLTIVEKLEKYGRQCEFALILLTADDETAGGGLRARQNVVHELGYFHGLLGRNKVLLLKEEGVELFTNISGIVYEGFPMGNVEATFEGIRRALQQVNAIGMNEKEIPSPSSNSKLSDGNTSKSIKSEFKNSRIQGVFNVQGGSVTINK